MIIRIHIDMAMHFFAAGKVFGDVIAYQIVANTGRGTRPT